MPKNILFWSIPQWGYDWGYSNAYIEIMCIDTVIMDFGGKKGVSKYDIDRTKEVWEKKKKESGNSAWGTVKKK